MCLCSAAAHWRYVVRWERLNHDLEPLGLLEVRAKKPRGKGTAAAAVAAAAGADEDNEGGVPLSQAAGGGGADEEAPAEAQTVSCLLSGF